MTMPTQIQNILVTHRSGQVGHAVALLLRIRGLLVENVVPIPLSGLPVGALRPTHDGLAGDLLRARAPDGQRGYGGEDEGSHGAGSFGLSL